ncbi:hypothetical protein SNE40_015018 [Patella caerulea]|uniref:Uncharacterized protein n=1 Tax=Patella caerulea TaxID=87958 RepID=A0AAN8JGW3_PATCE
MDRLHKEMVLVVFALIVILEIQCQFSGQAAFGPNLGGRGAGMGQQMGPGATPNINQLLGGQQKLADACQYLRSRTSIWGSNNAPFKLSTEGFYNEVRRGYPIEVAIKPWTKYQPDNFTDFIIYATEFSGAVNLFPNTRMSPQLLGVFKIMPRYSAGGQGFMCDPHAMGPDAVGSGEERRILISRALKPNNNFWNTRQSAIRQYAGFLWYPTEMTMGATMVQFTAKLKSDGHWYEIKSRKWPIYNPPDPFMSFNNLNMEQMRQLQRMF